MYFLLVKNTKFAEASVSSFRIC